MQEGEVGKCFCFWPLWALWGVLATFTVKLLPLVKSPWGKDHSWSQMHMRDSGPCAKITLAEQLCSGHAASTGPLTACSTPSGMCAASAEEGRYLSRLWGLFFGHCPVPVLQSHQKMSLKDRILAKKFSRVAHWTLFSSLFLAEPLKSSYPCCPPPFCPCWTYLLHSHWQGQHFFFFKTVQASQENICLLGGPFSAA